MISSNTLEYNDIRQGVRTGGGSRYREEHKTIDMTTEENATCGCWLCRESRRSNNSSWPIVRRELDETPEVWV